MTLLSFGGVVSWKGVALIAVAATIAVLAGCSRTVEKPLSFARDGLTIAGYTFDEGMKIADVALPAVEDSSGATYSLMPPVPGLTLHESTGVLSGTPSMAGKFAVTYTAKSADGQTASLKLTITVVHSFRGTWQAIFDWWEDGQVVGTYTDTVTFTKDRYILYRSHYLTDGTLDHGWSNSGTWETSGSTVTRIEDHDGDDATPDKRYRKHYFWGNEQRSTLCMQDWEWQHEESFSNCIRYTRKSDPVPSPVGVWQGSYRSRGADVTIVWTVSADGSFRHEARRPEGTFMVTAKWMHDKDNYYLNLTDARQTFTPVGGAPVPQDDFAGADRVAYALTDRSPNEIAVSMFWYETQARDSFRRYGDYWLTLVRQQ